MAEPWETRREKILRLLKETETPLSTDQISLLLEIDRKDVYEDLVHIARSLHKSRWQLIMFPPRCLKCGYVFSSDKPKKPSKCPKCRGERVSDPLFKVISR